MDETLEATVGSLGAPYADGTPNLEIKLHAAQAAGQPFVSPERTSVTLRVAGEDFAGSVLANKPDHDTVWFSPTLTGPGGERTSLGRVLSAAGFSANDSVSLRVSGTIVEVLPATGSRSA